jgi:hypothetical protein
MAVGSRPLTPKPVPLWGTEGRSAPGTPLAGASTTELVTCCLARPDREQGASDSPAFTRFGLS